VSSWEAAAFERLNLVRDPSILLCLAEAGVLTTGELCKLHFANADVCRRRLRVLRDLRLVVGFRPGRSRGAETCWALTERGAKVLGEVLGEAVRAGVWGRGEASARALPHRRAVAEFFMALAGAGDPHLTPVRAAGHHTLRAAVPGEPSTLWLGERSCRTVFGDGTRRPLGLRVALVPDGAAIVAAGEASGVLVLELDRGTESLDVVGEKIARYARVGGVAVVVCFTDPARATWRPPDLGVRVLVGDLASHLADPWEPVWRDEDGARVGLGDVTQVPEPVR
jgi:hypothetical protein